MKKQQKIQINYNQNQDSLNGSPQCSTSSSLYPVIPNDDVVVTGTLVVVVDGFAVVVVGAV